MRGQKIFNLAFAALALPLFSLTCCPLATNAAAPQGNSRNEVRPEIAFHDGLLTLRAQNRRLRWLLDEISREARIAVGMAEGMGEERLSVEFQNLPVDEALRQLLADYDAFFFYGGRGKGPASLRAVWVYPLGQGDGLEPVPPEEWASTKEIRERLADPDAKVRARAIEALIERRGDQAGEEVLKALEDKEAEVRTQALYRALAAGVELPQSVLTGLAISDRSPEVRFLALEALAAGPDARWIAERALSDPSPQVQQKAREILKGLEAAPPGKSGQPVQGQQPPRNRFR